MNEFLLDTKINDNDKDNNVLSELVCQKIQDIQEEFKIRPLQLEDYNKALNQLKHTTLTCNNINQKVQLILDSILLIYNLEVIDRVKMAAIIKNVSYIQQELGFLLKIVNQQLESLNEEDKKIISLLQPDIKNDFETVRTNIYILTICTQYLRGVKIIYFKWSKSISYST